MEISVAGKNIKLGESLEQYVEERIRVGIKKLLKDITSAEIVFSKVGYLFHTNILVKEGHGLGIIRSNFDSDEIYHSFDGAFIRLEKQLRKYKDKYKNHKATKVAHFEQFGDDTIAATKYIISQELQVVGEIEDQHLIIAEKATNVECLTVSEAVMKMDLAHVPALLFKNKDSSRLNIVYHRADGNIAWVDPEGSAV